MHTVEPILWTPEGVVMLDQLKLPGQVVYHTYTDYREVAKAIKDMVIRGAPAIGVAAAMGAALGVQNSKAATVEELRVEFAEICHTLAHTRPTAVDLFWALARFERRFKELAAEAASANGSALAHIRKGLVEEAQSPTGEVKTRRDIPWDIPLCATNAQNPIIVGKSNFQKTKKIQQISFAQL